MKNKSRWHILTLISCCCLALASLGLVCNCVGVFYSPMAADLGAGRGSVAMFATICTLMNGFVSPLFGKALRKFSLKAVLLGGICINALSAVGISMAQHLWQLYLLGAVQGVSLCFFCSVPVNLIISNWFHKNHGLATGVAMCFSGLGGAVFSPLFSAIISAAGWRMAYALLGALILIVAAPGALFVLKLDPSERNLLPFGADEPRKAPEKKAAAGKVITVSLPFVLLFAFGLLASFNTGLTQHLSGYAESVGLGTATGAMMISAAMMGNLSSKLFTGILSDWVGPVRACILMLLGVVAGIVLLLTVGAASIIAAMAASFMLGFVFAVCSVGAPLVTKHVFGNDKFGAVYPQVMVAINTGSAFALTIIGFIYDFTQSYTAAFLFCTALLLASCGLLLVLQKKKTA